MEFSEAFRAEDISKTDFFDFVVTPEDMGNDIVLHNNFPWSRKSLGLFGNNNNNHHHADSAHANGSCNNNDKEANNNILPSFGDETFWGNAATTKAAFVAAAAAVNVKMESPTLEDINDICWSSSTCIGTPESDEASRVTNQRLEDKDEGNTDGSIYTLTVVNGPTAPAAPTAPAPPPPWYRPPDLSSILREGDEHLRQAMSAMDPGGQYQTSLDIDSIISILPSLPSLNEDHSLFTAAPESAAESDLLGSGKLSQHSADSGFAETKEELPAASGAAGTAEGAVGAARQGSDEVQQQQQQQQQGYSENNNDWTFSNNESSAESLLRSALQGGKSFISQYNGLPQDNKTLTELQAGSLGLFMSGDSMLPMDGGGSVLLFDDSDGGMYSNGPSQCMDDILLSPLDDYEKLKLIENEVVESAKQYGGGGLDPHGLGHAAHPAGSFMPLPPAAPAPPAPHSSTKPKKKSGKKDRQSLPKLKSPSGSAAAAASALASAQPGSNGARRERSLHHCTICSKAFKDKYSVNVHIRTHTGEKPFACSVCGKSFRQKAHLAKHYHTHIVQKNEALGLPKPLPTKAR